MSDDQTPRLGLRLLAASQMQKHVTLNETLTRLDALVQCCVASRSTTAQPPNPADGSLYILPAGATGTVWANRPAGSLLCAEAGGWSRVDVSDGLIALVLDEDHLVIRHQGLWHPLGGRLGIVQGLNRLGIGTSADAANPFAAKLNKALWTALEASSGGDGDLRLILNKETSADALSLLLQSAYGGRAEFGLIGDDDFRLKVSADGSSWKEAFSVARATGKIAFALGAVRRELTAFTADGTYSVPEWAQTLEAVVVGGGGGGGAGGFAPTGPQYGGGGGGAGGIARATWAASEVSAGLQVVVGSGGQGADGGPSSIRLGDTTLLTATGGGFGGSGSASQGIGGKGGLGSTVSNGGGASSVLANGSEGQSLIQPDAPGGGGAGGGLDETGVARSGGPGGDGGALAVKAQGGDAGTGWSGGGGWGAPKPACHWSGGGGGGGGASSSGAGHAGADGGSAGGGGGGGGAGRTAGGPGGKGAGGIVWLIALG